MTSLVSGRKLFHLNLVAVLILCVFALGCASSSTLADDRAALQKPDGSDPAVKFESIPVSPGGPADAVRTFYKHLREKRFREAVFLTNLRPAVEGLTDSELKEFSLDFEKIAGRVPAVVEINGEIISGKLATVTANLPADDEEKNEIQTIKLRNDNGIWVILTVDPEAEERIRKEGRNYFYHLKVETHEQEAREMLERISKAQLAFSLQNGGRYGDLNALISGGLLPDDARSSDSTGYNYVVTLTSENKRYSATATPAVYGKTGRLSFLLRLDEKGVSRATSRDNGGKPLLP